MRDTFKDTSIAPHPNQWCTPPHQSGVIRAVHAWMPTCVCVVAIHRDGQELRRLNAVAARCRHTSTRPGCTQTEHGRLLSTAHCCRPVSREQDTEHMQSEQAPDPLQQRRPTIACPNQLCTHPHQSGVIRAVHALMPACVCVVATARLT